MCEISEEQTVELSKVESRITGMLGLARRAGKLAYGFDSVLKNIATGKAETVLLSSDASPRTCSKFKEACEDSDVTILTLTFTKQVLGRAIGRDDTAVVAVTDNSFAKKIIEIAGDGAENPVAGGK